MRKIKDNERLKTPQSIKKSYADKQHKELQFEKGGFVFLKVSPTKGVMRFGNKVKLNPMYIGPFKIIGQVKNGNTYQLELPQQLMGVHYVFHVSILRKYEPNPSHVIDFEPVNIQ